MHTLQTKPTTAPAHSDRRKLPRYYLTEPLQADLLHGARKLSIESARIGNISTCGIGLRSALPVGMAPGTTVTVALAQDDSVCTVTGEVASIHAGTHIGIKVDEAGKRALRSILDCHPDSVTISPPQNGKSYVVGAFTMHARHPVQWAVSGGATRLNMERATVIESSGIGMLLLLNERIGLTIEHCVPQICRTIKLCRMPSLCAPDCPRDPDRHHGN